MAVIQTCFKPGTAPKIIYSPQGAWLKLHPRIINVGTFIPSSGIKCLAPQNVHSNEVISHSYTKGKAFEESRGYKHLQGWSKSTHWQRRHADQAPVQHYNGCTAGELYPFPMGAQQSHIEGFYYLDKEQWLNNTCSLEIYRPISQRVVCNSITIQKDGTIFPLQYRYTNNFPATDGPVPPLTLTK